MSWTKISAPKALANQVTASHIIHGPSIPPQQRLLTYSPAEWEEFVHEWAHYSLKQLYVSVERFSGAGDAGIDVAGFTDFREVGAFGQEAVAGMNRVSARDLGGADDGRDVQPDRDRRIPDRAGRQRPRGGQ